MILSWFMLTVLSKPFKFSDALEGKTTIYTQKLIELAKNKTKFKEFCNLTNNPFQLQQVGVRTASDPYYVGFKKCMVIQAPISAVLKTKRDVSNFSKIFPGLASVTLAESLENQMVLTWERKSPVFFYPNIFYQIGYIIDEADPKSVWTRYQLKSGDRVKAIDGMELLEQQGPQKTLFVNYDFNTADYGVVGINTVSAERVWNDNIEGSIVSLLAIRNRSEHPEWSPEKVVEESKKTTEKILELPKEFVESL